MWAKGERYFTDIGVAAEGFDDLFDKTVVSSCAEPRPSMIFLAGMGLDDAGVGFFVSSRRSMPPLRV